MFAPLASFFGRPLIQSLQIPISIDRVMDTHRNKGEFLGSMEHRRATVEQCVERSRRSIHLMAVNGGREPRLGS